MLDWYINLETVTLKNFEQYRKELVHDASIYGIESSFIRQDLLENKSLNLMAAHSRTYRLYIAQHDSWSEIWNSGFNRLKSFD